MTDLQAIEAGIAELKKNEHLPAVLRAIQILEEAAIRIKGQVVDCHATGVRPRAENPMQEQVYVDAFAHCVHEGNAKAMESCRDDYFKKSASDLYEVLRGFWFFRCLDFSQTPPYFLYDTDDNTVKENEYELWEIQEELLQHGFELIDTLVEHDCITGHLNKGTQK